MTLRLFSLGIACDRIAFTIFPELAKVITIGYYGGGPIFIFEISVGFWLVLKGITPPSVRQAEAA